MLEHQRPFSGTFQKELELSRPLDVLRRNLFGVEIRLAEYLLEVTEDRQHHNPGNSQRLSTN